MSVRTEKGQGFDSRQRRIFLRRRHIHTGSGVFRVNNAYPLARGRAAGVLFSPKPLPPTVDIHNVRSFISAHRTHPCLGRVGTGDTIPSAFHSL
jgi:hypothetical protein